MLLFPGEEAAYAGKAGWRVIPSARGPVLLCPGRCAREERPLSCRLFPLLPLAREDGGIRVVTDRRARAVCPLLRQGIRGTDPAFRDAVREAGRILAEDPEQREFLEMLTAEQDELKALREKLGGI